MAGYRKHRLGGDRDPGPFVEVGRVGTRLQVDVLVASLQARGISAIPRYGDGDGWQPHLAVGSGFGVLAPERDAARARRLLGEWATGSRGAPDDGGVPPDDADGGGMDADLAGASRSAWRIVAVAALVLVALPVAALTMPLLPLVAGWVVLALPLVAVAAVLTRRAKRR